MKAAEVHNLKDDELVAKLIDAKQEAFNLRFRHATGELENTARLGPGEEGHRPAADRGQGTRHRRGERDATDMSDDETKKEETAGREPRTRALRPRVLPTQGTPVASSAGDGPAYDATRGRGRGG